MKYFFSVLLIVAGFAANAQIDTTTPPYQQTKRIPSFKILLRDSASFYSKANLPANKAVLFMIFSPECSHCQHETEQMIAHRDELKNIQIVMITMHPLEKMKEFISKYQLSEYPNLVVGRDIYYTTPVFFALKNLPFLAMYNKKGELIAGYEGSLGITDVIRMFNAEK